MNYNSKFLAIIEVFKTYKYYLKSYKSKVFLFIGYNNLQYFINTKNFSSK